ncbi:EAL domain-containing protein, partial [Pseudomonas aeruginosa]
IHLDTVKREFVGSILKMARASRAQVIAEGIELPEELAVLSEMGVDLVQGYLFGRPQEHPASDVQQMLPSAGPPSQSSGDEHGDLRALLLEQRAVDVRTSTQEVVEIFRRQANLNSLAILDEEGRPIGI